MSRHELSPLRLSLALLSATLAALAAPPGWPHAFAQTVAPPRVVAVGDVHGALDAFVSILQQAQIVDERRRWRGGRATLVQTGDFTDRGADVRGVMDLLMSLEREAKAAGGRTIVLLGNHETMNLIGEWRDVTPEIFATFADAQSEKRREAAFKTYARLMAKRAAAATDAKVAPPTALSKEAWLAAHPPGFVEYAQAFSPSGRYGSWLRAHAPLARIGDSLFMHAGFDPPLAPKNAEDLNHLVRDEIARFDAIRRTLADADLAAPWFTLQELLDVVRSELTVAEATGGEAVRADPTRYRALADLATIGEWTVVNPDRALWFRGYAHWSDEEGAPAVTHLLDRFRAARFVVGHTPQATGRINSRFDQRVFLIDTGMLASTYKGRPSALEMQAGAISALYLDRRDVLAPAARGEGPASTETGAAAGGPGPTGTRPARSTRSSSRTGRAVRRDAIAPAAPPRRRASPSSIS